MMRYNKLLVKSRMMVRRKAPKAASRLCVMDRIWYVKLNGGLKLWKIRYNL